MNKDIILNKLAVLNQEIADHIDSLPDSDFSSNTKAESKDYYSNLFLPVTQEVNSYFSDYHKSARQLQVLELITSVYNLLLISGREATNGHIISGLDNLSPTLRAMNDYSIFFKMQPFLDYISTLTYSDLYLDQLMASDAMLALEDKAASTYNEDNAGVTALISAIKNIGFTNTLTLLFEETFLTGSSNLNKAEVAQEIYVNKKLRDVISFYNLDIYVPSSVRLP